MKRNPKKYILLSLSLAAVIYLAVAFILCNLLWFTNIPKYSIGDRVIMVFALIVKEVITLFINDTVINNSSYPNIKDL